MKRALLASIASVWLATQPQPVSAQVIVHDPTAYANLLQQAQTALNQLNELKSQVIEAKRLYDGFNQISDVNSLAAALSTPALRAFVPQIETYVAASNGDFSGLGELGEAADLIRQTHRLFSAKPGDVLGQELERIGDRGGSRARVGEVGHDDALARLAVDPDDAVAPRPQRGGDGGPDPVGGPGDEGVERGHPISSVKRTSSVVSHARLSPGSSTEASPCAVPAP